MKNSLRKSIATLGLTAAVILGSAGVASAHDNAGNTGTSTSATKSDRGGKGQHLASLVTAGTITQAQADAITAAFKAAKPAAGTAKPATPPTDAERLAKHKAVLAPLVSAGTITQAQADAVIAAMPARGPRGGGDGQGKGGRGPKGTKSTTGSTSGSTSGTTTTKAA
jgi:hypothetical protein